MQSAAPINHQPIPPMEAIKAIYKEGSIQLPEPLKDEKEAELFVIVLDKDKITGSVVNTFQASANNKVARFNLFPSSGVEMLPPGVTASRCNQFSIQQIGSENPTCNKPY